MSTALDELLTFDEIREVLNVSRATLYRWIGEGLPSHQPGGPKGRRLFDPDEVAVWIKSRCLARHGDNG